MKSKQVKISDLIVPGAIVLDLEGDYVEDVFSRLVKLLLKEKKKEYSLSSFYEIVNNLIWREQLQSTAIGKGLAFPCAHISEAIFSKPVIAIGISKKGLRWLLPGSQNDYNYGFFDGKPVHIVFLALFPLQGEKRTYPVVMAHLWEIRKDKQFMDNLRKATSVEEILQIVKRRKIWEIPQ